MDTGTEGEHMMPILYVVRKTGTSVRKMRYHNLSLVKLVKRIVDKGDRLALEEFHTNRTLFRYKDKPLSLFIDYLKELRESTARRTWLAPNALELADKAYDFTIDKFNNLPRRTKNKSSLNVEQSGADCRYYFNAFLEYVTRSFRREPPANEIEEEARVATIMQGMVSRHFYLSRLEAERVVNPFWSRYNWKIGDHTICVWLPISLEGRKRQTWLRKNIDKPNPRRPGERERIQSIIDQKLPREKVVTWSEGTHISSEEKSSTWSESDKTFGISLAEAVAEEKSRNIQRQRPSIRALGGEKLKQLVLRIFRDISSSGYEDGKVARVFCLSKPTFSRFAGSRWVKSETAIPDLWLNTAEVLSTNPIFREVAIGASVWKQVQITLERGAPPCEEEISHVQ
jgi:hypothetical protein